MMRCPFSTSVVVRAGRVLQHLLGSFILPTRFTNAKHLSGNYRGVIGTWRISIGKLGQGAADYVNHLQEVAIMKRGFSLVELLVVIGILALLAGIIAGVTLKMGAHAEQVRIQADLATLATALNAYKQDFGDYPRIPPAMPPIDPSAPPSQRERWVILAPGADPLMNELGNPDYIYGSEILTWAIVAPYPATGSGFTPGDGADGLGWRERGTRGQAVGSYIDISKFRIKSLMGRYQTLVDYEDMPILYVPAGRQRNAASDPATGYVRRSAAALWDFRYIDPAFSIDGNDSAARLTRVQSLMGDLNSNGYIDIDPVTKQPLNGESVIQGSFILWSAGLDGEFGNLDDVKVTE
jgi:prepilin-type N-terminal cleavage/methylation domain-containing protein